MANAPGKESSRAKAKGQKCAWHQWRDAYAMCAYCNRPFCYQDLSEYNGLYYCVEDLDAVAPARARNSAELNATAMAAGILLLVSALIFFYFAYAALLQTAHTAASNGLLLFSMADWPQSLLIIDSIIVFLGFAAALLLFVQSGAGFRVGVVASIGAIILFTYQAAVAAPLYYKALDAIVIVVLLLLLYSRAQTASDERTLKSEQSVNKSNLSKWPEVGRF